jgi:hypothetical protein
MAASQKVYIEHVVGAMTTSFAFCFGTIGTSLAAGPGGGISTPSTKFGILTNGTFHCGDAPWDTGPAIPSVTVGDRIGIAFDSGGLLVWFRKNGGIWNVSDVAGDPVAGTNGIVVPNMGTLYAIGNMDGNTGDVFTTNFASTDWADAAPAGYTQLAA